MDADKKLETKEEFEARIAAQNALRVKTRIRAGATRRTTRTSVTLSSRGY